MSRKNLTKYNKTFQLELIGRLFGMGILVYHESNKLFIEKC
jgi:hypothetical protein